MNHQTQNPTRRTHLGLISAIQSQITSFSQNYYVTIVDANDRQRVVSMDGYQHSFMQESLNKLNIDDNDFIYLWLEVDDQDNLLDWALLTTPYSLEYMTLLYSHCYSSKDFIRFFNLINSLTDVNLKSFLWALFSKERLAIKFMSVKASINHHHNFPGGLLYHSIEVARMTKQALRCIHDFPRLELELAIVAALLHDIGKVQTHDQNGSLTQEGFSVPHDAYTLKQISPEIEQLKSQNLQLGIALEYLLTWKEGRGFPRLESANIIRAADRTSTAFDLKQKAFSNKPEGFHYAPTSIKGKASIFQRLN